MKEQNKENRTESVKTDPLQALTSAYFSFVAFVTKPLYLYYQSKLVDASQINEIETNLGKRRTEVFLTRR